MATNPSAFTTLSTGSVTVASLTQAAASPWLPGDNGLLAASSPLPDVSNAFTLVTGTLYLRRIFIRSPVLATNVWFVVSTAGAGASSGSFAGLINSSGTLLSSSADIGVSLASAAAVSVPLTTPQSLAAGSFVWAAVISTLATTQPTLRSDCANSGLPGNLNLTAAVFNAASNGAAMASITPSANVSAAPMWFGIN